MNCSDEQKILRLDPLCTCDFCRWRSSGVVIYKSKYRGNGGAAFHWTGKVVITRLENRTARLPTVGHVSRLISEVEV